MSYSDTTPSDIAEARQGSVSLVAAIAERGEMQDELYLRFRRPLLQVFQQRRIDPDAAQDLLQRTFLQAIKKIRADGLDDPSNLGGYLYRTATKLAAGYWRGELAHQHDILARAVRELIEELPTHRDREVLERFYLREEPRVSICESLNLTSLQLNQVLWRARQRFGEILRKHGMSRGLTLAAHATEG